MVGVRANMAAVTIIVYGKNEYNILIGFNPISCE